MKLWVEASAGSGKTTDLMAGGSQPSLKKGRAQLRDIVAITFTEKAAGELKLRVREELEKQRLASQGQIRERLDAAVFQLEQAHFQTFHGFCQELLREHRRGPKSMQPSRSSANPNRTASSGNASTIGSRVQLQASPQASRGSCVDASKPPTGRVGPPECAPSSNWPGACGIIATSPAIGSTSPGVPHSGPALA